jgi:hypothetical protein
LLGGDQLVAGLGIAERAFERGAIDPCAVGKLIAGLMRLALL